MSSVACVLFNIYNGAEKSLGINAFKNITILRIMFLLQHTLIVVKIQRLSLSETRVSLSDLSLIDQHARVCLTCNLIKEKPKFILNEL